MSHRLMSKQTTVAESRAVVCIYHINDCITSHVQEGLVLEQIQLSEDHVIYFTLPDTENDYL